MKNEHKIMIIISIILLLISSYPLFNIIIEAMSKTFSSMIILLPLRIIGLLLLFIPIYNIMKNNINKKIYKIIFIIFTIIEIIALLLLAITINSKLEFIPIIIIIFGTLSTPINSIFLIYQSIYIIIKKKIKAE